MSGAYAVVRYERAGGMVRISLLGTTNHELREVMVGLFCRLGAEDRADHLRELAHYAGDPAAWLSPVAAAIKQAGTGAEGAIDLAALAERGEKVRP